MSEETNFPPQYKKVQSSSSVAEDEIDLIELIHTLLRAWKTIAGITIVCIGLAIAYALYAPEVYSADTLLAPASEEKTGASSALSQFGGLAAMAGISIPTDSNVDRVMATLESRKFLSHFIEKKNLLPVLFEKIWDSENQVWLIEPDEKPSQQQGVTLFKSLLSVDENKLSGLISLSISWYDPSIAAKWANELVNLLNEQLREQAIAESRKRVGYLEHELTKTTLQDMRAVLYNLLESEKQKAMLANVNQEFALKVIDPAIAPEIRDKPKRKLIVTLGGVLGVFTGIFYVFFIQFIMKIKSSIPSKISA